MSYNITFVCIKLIIFFAQNCNMNFRQAFQVSLWNHWLYCLYMVFFPSIAFNQLKRKFAMCVITKPFTFWRIFKKARILKFGIDYVILNTLLSKNRTYSFIWTFRYQKNTRYCKCYVICRWRAMHINNSVKKASNFFIVTPRHIALVMKLAIFYI